MAPLLVEDVDDNSIHEEYRPGEDREPITNEPENLQSEEEDEDEEECRVCRGPAEEGRPLLKPCKCSGSMGMVHQECLISWLEVTRGDGRCEICKTKFHFDPQYAENTPDRLPGHEVILGLSSRFLAKCLPFAFRVSFAVVLWLVVAPYLTNCLYLGWIIRPSSILARHQTIYSDIVSGAVIGAIIIISFLSLMSFADFLRVLWQQPPAAQQADGEEQPQREAGRQNAAFGGDDDDDNDNNEDEIYNNENTDNTIIEILFIESMKDNTENSDAEESINDESTDDDSDAKTTNRKRARPEDNEWKPISNFTEKGHDKNDKEDADNNNIAADLDGNALDQHHAEPDATDVVRNLHGLHHEDDIGDVADYVHRMDRDDPVDADNAGQFFEPEDADEDEVGNENHDEDDMEPLDRNVVDEDEEAWMDNGEFDNNEDDAPPQVFNGFFDGMDAVQDDQVDMEINVALDELLGLRGPISTLVRNLLWLLAFNATYLGIFGFIPKTVGAVIYSGFFNTTLCDNVLKTMPYVSSDDGNKTTVVSLLSSLEKESVDRNTTFKLSDFATVTLGYLSMASFIVLSRYAIIFIQKAGKPYLHNSRNVVQNIQEARRLNNRVAAPPFREGLELGNDDAIVGIGESVETALDATVAIIKVCVLLFMKMFLLPLSLGLWLDASTMRLFGHDVARRLAFAGGDLFSFLLLHWVAGITIMLLVTIFLLQLREVVHPDILAPLIRPQEPQPDLLGNLMHETVVTHVKRMFLSLAIYAPLLTIHVTLPVMLFHASGLDESFDFFHLNFYHLLTPQLQIPLELVVFHLSMLALLERHKNTIGGLQHGWMKFMCRRLEITEHLLPRKVTHFEFVGTKPIFKSKDDNGNLEVDPFFSTLATQVDIDQFVLSNIDRQTNQASLSSNLDNGEHRLNGERVLSGGVAIISLPTATGEENDVFRLPTKIGRYRLRVEKNYLDMRAPERMKISFYREVQGDEIRRPPEGWDDLGAGGAYVQGRWAWAKERKSRVEASVAERTQFRASSKERRSIRLLAKVAILIILSWFAVTFTSLAIVSFPLAVGRLFYHLLRIPSKYIHDPLAFCIGSVLFFPAVSLLARSINAVDESLHLRCLHWVQRFRRPPTRKVLVVLEAILLWIAVAPLAFGLSYDFVLVKSPKWFLREEAILDTKTCAISWFMGTIVLNTWSFLLYCKVFTRQFWTNVGNGMLDPPLNDDGNPNPNARNNNREDTNAENGLIWQGKQGRVAKFFKIWKSMMLDWEWDAVDRTILIDQFARPTTREIVSTLVGSSLSYLLALYAFVAMFKVRKGSFMFPVFGAVEVGIFRKLLFRFCMAVHVLFQIGSRSRSRIDRWFEAAHEAARDDRYLIGELLMNYNPELQTN